MSHSSRRFVAVVLAALVGGAVPELSASAATTGEFRNWNYVLQTGQGGEPNRALAQVRGEEGSSLWLSCTRIAGDEGEPPQAAVALTVMQKAFLGPSDPRGRSTVYWLDDRPPEVSHWIYRDRYGQLRGESEVMDFVTSLATAKTLIVELANFRLEPQSVKFSLDPTETSAVAERFSKDCQSIAAAMD
jgi:hypothetical protein